MPLTEHDLGKRVTIRNGHESTWHPCLRGRMIGFDTSPVSDRMLRIRFDNQSIWHVTAANVRVIDEMPDPDQSFIAQIFSTPSYKARAK